MGKQIEDKIKSGDVKYPYQSKNYKSWPSKGSNERGPIESLGYAAKESAKLIASGYKNIGKVIGTGAGRIAYGPIAETPASVKSNRKRKVK